MPRDVGTGVYHYPDGTPGNPGQTVFSARYNTFINDLSLTLNQKLPINMGGTGADDAAEARDNLDAEVATQQVTSYDSHVFESGSFYSHAGATGAPTAGGAFTGTCQLHGSAGYITLEARDVLDTVVPGRLYIRQKIGDVWGAWTGGAAGETMTGNLTISKAQPSVILNRPDNTTQAVVVGAVANSVRWAVSLGNSGAADDFSISRYNDAAVFQNTPFLISRATGDMLLTGIVTTTSNVGVGGHFAVTVSPGAAPGSSNSNIGFSVLSDGRIFASCAGAGGAAGSFNANTDGFNLVFNRSGTVVGSITVTTTATAYNTSSDERLKEDLKSFDAGNIVDDTNVYDFAWKSTGERSYGVIAQQAKDIYPHATFHDEKEDRWFIDYSKYVPVLLQEMKALRARVAELEGKLMGGAQPA